MSADDCTPFIVLPISEAEEAWVSLNVNHIIAFWGTDSRSTVLMTGKREFVVECCPAIIHTLVADKAAAELDVSDDDEQTSLN